MDVLMLLQQLIFLKDLTLKVLSIKIKFFFTFFLNKSCFRNILLFLKFQALLILEISFLRIWGFLKRLHVVRNSIIQVFFELQIINQFQNHQEIKVIHQLILLKYILLPTYLLVFHSLDLIAIQDFYTIL